MKVGLKLSPQLVSWSALEEGWMAAGASDAFESVWAFDHLYPIRGDGPCLEGWTTLAALAHLAPGKTVGHLVLAAPYRHPGLLAKMATAMDHATRGHFVLGLGAGWHEPETTAYDLPLPPLPERMRLLGSTLRIVRALLRPATGTAGSQPREPGEAIAPGDIEAPPWHLRQPRNDPPPLGQGPPIWIGTEGERVGLRLVARYADGWNHSAAREVDPVAFARRLQILRRHCDAVGRDPASIEVSVQLPVTFGEAGHRRAVEQARAFREAGCDHLVLIVEAARGAAAVEAAAREVVPALR